jgi:hypothetical protein
VSASSAAPPAVQNAIKFTANLGIEEIRVDLPNWRADSYRAAGDFEFGCIMGKAELAIIEGHSVGRVRQKISEIRFARRRKIA